MTDRSFNGIGWAVKQLRDGYMVRRRTWESGAFIYCARGDIWFRKPSVGWSIFWKISQSDVLAINWEIASNERNVVNKETHDGLPVAGYRPQSTNSVDLVNANKLLEEQVLREFDALAAMPDVDKRWLAVGRTHIEQGFMAVNRAIFQPSRVKFPGEE